LPSSLAGAGFSLAAVAGVAVTPMQTETPKNSEVAANMLLNRFMSSPWAHAKSPIA